MKKYLILLLLATLGSFGYSQPNITEISFPDSVKLFDLYEIAFQLDDYPNPYDPKTIDVHAEFLSPNGKSFTVNGFYFEGYTFKKHENYEVATASRDKGWRVRFTPDQVGDWSFTIHTIDRQGDTILSSVDGCPLGFCCDSVSSAEGFISIANKHFLKRDLVVEGQRKQHSFFPSGPNIAWYEYTESPIKPRGIYDYDKYIDSIAGSANFMRIWLNRYQYLSLYGTEFTQRVDNKPVVYFDSSLNQKDAAELDHIIDYAARNGITIMPCIFTFGDFFNKHLGASRWDNNPFHTVLGLDSSTEFFTSVEAKRITKNLIRYIVARWGYATNIVCWEFWNEIDNIPNGNLSAEKFQRNIVSWHEEMAQYTRSIDPFQHPLTTSTTTLSGKEYLSSHIFEPLDIVQWHTYGNIQKAKSKEQRAHQLFVKRSEVLGYYPDKPFFVGEFGFGQSSKEPKYEDKDPFGFDTHNGIWASLFSASMGPASFWFWAYLDKKDLFRIYQPLLTFAKDLPLLSDSFSARHTAETTHRSTIFPNALQTYYMINAAEDTLYGWCQDTAFSYQALRRLTDYEGKNGHFDDNGLFDPKGYVYTLDQSKKPQPSSRSNTIYLPIDNQPVGTQYTVRWYDAETGLEMPVEKTVAVVQKNFWRGQFISFDFPSSVRNLKQNTITNTFGDAVFSIILENSKKEGSNADDNAPQTSKRTVIKLKTSPSSNGSNQ